MNGKYYKSKICSFGVLILAALLQGCTATRHFKKPKSVFAKNNLTAWCIVPYDSKNRTAEERALMLKELGITKLAYDWREKHIAVFEDEFIALKKHEIKLQAFWYMSGLQPENDKTLQLVFDLLKKHGLKTQIWLMMIGEKEFKSATQHEKVTAMAKPVAYIANKAAEAGCTIGLYNHGGWFGEPENQLAIIDYLKLPNIGMVYNFSHAEYQIQRFPEFFPKILPHLYALNVTGLKGGYPAKVVPVGQGNIELEMMRVVKESTYKGPVGIINEDFALDAKDGLLMNINGMKQIVKQLNDQAALKTY